MRLISFNLICRSILLRLDWEDESIYLFMIPLSFVSYLNCSSVKVKSIFEGVLVTFIKLSDLFSTKKNIWIYHKQPPLTFRKSDFGEASPRVGWDLPTVWGKSGYVAPVKQNDMRLGEPSPINEKHHATRWVDVSLEKNNKTGSFLKACDLAFGILKF